MSLYHLNLRFKLNSIKNISVFNKNDLSSNLNMKRYLIFFNDSNYYQNRFLLKSQSEFDFVRTKLMSVSSQFSNLLLLEKNLISNLKQTNNSFFFMSFDFPFSLISKSNLNYYLNDNKLNKNFVQFISNLSQLNHYLLSKYYYINNKLNINREDLNGSFNKYTSLHQPSIADNDNYLSDIPVSFFFYYNSKFINFENYLNNNLFKFNFIQNRLKYNLYIYIRKILEININENVINHSFKNQFLNKYYLYYDNYYNYHNINNIYLKTNLFTSSSLWMSKSKYYLNFILNLQRLKTEITNVNENHLQMDAEHYIFKNIKNINTFFYIPVFKNIITNTSKLLVNKINFISMNNIIKNGNLLLDKFKLIYINNFIIKKNILDKKDDNYVNLIKLRNLYYLKELQLPFFSSHLQNSYYYNKKRLSLRRF